MQAKACPHLTYSKEEQMTVVDLKKEAKLSKIKYPHSQDIAKQI